MRSNQEAHQWAHDPKMGGVKSGYKRPVNVKFLVLTRLWDFGTESMNFLNCLQRYGLVWHSVGTHAEFHSRRTSFECSSLSKHCGDELQSVFLFFHLCVSSKLTEHVTERELLPRSC